MSESDRKAQGVPESDANEALQDDAASDPREELIREIASGERRFYQVPRKIGARTGAEVRRRALERMTGTALDHVGHYSLDAEAASTRHCENFIGAAQIPMGVVGPITVHGERERDVLVPLATTEGALLASINRGCAAIRAAGGARVFVEDVGMTRAPAFRTAGIDESLAFLEWIEEHEEDIRTLAESTSRFLKLREIRPFHFGTNVFLRFRFESGDAMGMNMVTVACDRIVRELIEPETGVPCVALSGNYCVDKKPAAINFQEGRGKRIHAEVLLDASVLSKYLKTDARSLVEVQYRKNLMGSVAAGAEGYNAHIANTVAAFFVATGQDLAHVVGAAMGVTSIEARGPDSVYASVFLPDLPVGAVGGGTTLATQRQALDVLGISADRERPGKAAIEIAETVGAAVLAGELSLMAAFTSQDLARAHERLGRSQSATAARRDATRAGASAQPTPTESVAVSTPGKVILMGEHAAVYGRPALVAAVDLRLEARVSPLEGEGSCLLDLPQLGLKHEVTADELSAYAAAARERWQRYSERPDESTFADLRGEDPAHVVKTALGEAIATTGMPVPRFSLRINSDLPVGSGMGSSASTAVAAIAAYLRFVGHEAPNELVERLAFETERRQHGTPSGIDTASVIGGGLLWAHRDAGGAFDRQSLGEGSSLLRRLAIFHTGTPHETTGAVVAAVRERAAADPLRHEDLFDRLERATWSLRRELARPEAWPDRAVALIREGEACLEELGVVPASVAELIREIESHGGAAKISGAGALSGSAAGTLLVFHPDPAVIDTWSFLDAVPRYRVDLGAPGLRVETTS